MKKIFLLLSFIGIGIWGFAQTVTTNAASALNYDDATFNGTVDTAGFGAGDDAEVYFAYKKSGPGGYTFTSGIAISGSGSQSYSLVVDGLDVNQGYKYYVLLYNNDDDNEVDGSTVNFTTKEKPTASTTTPATNVDQTSADVAGSVDGKGNDRTFTCEFYYREQGTTQYTHLTASPSTVHGSGSQAESASITGLSVATTYEYIMVVNHTEGLNTIVDANGSTETFTTSAATTPTVTSGSIESITTTTFKVNDSEVSDDGGADIDDYGVYVDANNPPTTKDQTGTSGTTPIVYDNIFTGGSAGHTYYAQAYAHNSEGETKGVVRTIKTTCDAPTIAAETDLQAESFTANWASVTGAEDYSLDVSTQSDFSSHVAGYPKNTGNVTSYSVGSLSQDQDYYYRVTALNDGGDGDDTESANSGKESLHTLVSEPTTQATNLTWEKLSSTSFRLYWDNGNGAGRIAVVKVNSGITDPSDGTTYTANSSFGSGSDIGGGSYVVYDGSSKATSVDVTNLVDDGTEYYIKVYEYNGSADKTNYNTTATGGDNYGKTTLPVSLLSFSAKSVNDNVLISWETASELNNDYFIVERSLDGENFNEIASIEGSGNSNILLSYEFVDKQELNGVVYYRLTQFDYDGKSTVFNMISINIDNKDKTIETVFVDNKLLSIDLNINTKASVSLVDANGKVSQMVILPSEGKRNLKFDMNTLSRGVYFIIVDDGDNISSRKFVY